MEFFLGYNHRCVVKGGMYVRAQRMQLLSYTDQLRNRTTILKGDFFYLGNVLLLLLLLENLLSKLNINNGS